MSKKQEVYRGLEVSLMDGSKKVLKISKAVVIKAETARPMILFEALPDGTWRFTHTEDVIPDGALLDTLKIVREKP